MLTKIDKIILMSKHAVVFGATSGIGKELSKLLVADGYKVLITGRRLEKLEALKAENPQQYIIKQHDVTDIESSDILFKEIIDTLKTIDLVVYSSGVGGPNYNLDWQIEYNTIATNVLRATKYLDWLTTFLKTKAMVIW